MQYRAPPPPRGERRAAAARKGTRRTSWARGAAPHRADGARSGGEPLTCGRANPLPFARASRDPGPLRLLALADRRRDRRPRPRLGLLDAHPALRRRVLVRGAPAGRGPRRDRRALPRQRPGRRAAARLQRAHPRARVRRRRLHRARGDACSSATTPTSACTGWTPAAPRGRSPRSPRRRSARATPTCASARTAPARLRARARGEPRERQRARRAAGRRLGEPR